MLPGVDAYQRVEPELADEDDVHDGRPIVEYLA
jgi:hypothetical protein